MRVRLLSLILLISGTVIAQTKPLSTGKAVANGTCVVANSGEIKTVTIQCGIGAAQGQQMIEILNKILSNQEKLPPDIVLQKLDEILKNINPNRPVKTYFCDGQWRTVGPGAHAGQEISMGGDSTEFSSLIAMLNEHNYTSALRRCTADISDSTEWLTPLLVCGIAYRETGDIAKAKKMIDEFDSRTGPSYSEGACKQMADMLHQISK